MRHDNSHHTPSVIQRRVDRHQRENLVSAHLARGYIKEAELDRYTTARLKALHELVVRTEDEYRDLGSLQLRAFRVWFVRGQLHLPCVKTARDALRQLVPEAEHSWLVSTSAVQALRRPLMDYLTFPGLPRYVLVSIIRAQLGLPNVNGSIPREWNGLAFADMVRAYLELTTSRDARRDAKLVIAKIIADQELEGVSGLALVGVASYVREFLRNPCPEPYDRIGEHTFIDMVRIHLGLEALGYVPDDVLGEHLGATLQTYLERYQHELSAARRPILAGITN